MTNTSFCSLWYSVVITKNWKPKLEQHSVYILMEMIWQVINEMTRYFVFCKIPQFLGKINRRKKNKTFHGNEHFFIIKQIINTNIVTFQTIINTFTYKFQIEFWLITANLSDYITNIKRISTIFYKTISILKIRDQVLNRQLWKTQSKSKVKNIH